MICDLSHLHNETENVGVVVEQDTLCNVCLELAGTVVHDTASKVVLFLSKELTVDVNFLGWEFHRRGMIALDTTKHESISENSKLSKRFLARTLIAKLLNGIQQFLIEDRDMLHAAMVTVSAAILLVHIPIEGRAWALLAEVAGKWTNIEETDEGEKFADAILQWCS
jgi:hypothetical protein